MRVWVVTSNFCTVLGVFKSEALAKTFVQRHEEEDDDGIWPPQSYCITEETLTFSLP